MHEPYLQLEHKKGAKHELLAFQKNKDSAVRNMQPKQDGNERAINKETLTFREQRNVLES